MSRKSKFRSLAAAFVTAVMVLTVGVTSAFAAGGGTITVTNARVGETYSVYKVFDAVGDGTGATGKISYKLMPGKKDAPAGFSVDGAGNVTYSGTGQNGQLTDADIAAIAKYVKSDEAVASQNADSTTVTFNNLEDGYYYITTTSGTAVTVNSTNHNVSVEDKTVNPALSKVATAVEEGSILDSGKQVIARVGAKVTYTLELQVNEGAQNYVFHDVMDAGLTYTADSIKVYDGDPATATPLEAAGKFNVIAPGANGDTITVTFENSWIATQVGKTLKIQYTATVGQEAVGAKTPLKNKAWLTYGQAGKTPERQVEHYTAQITITKTDGQNPLAGAGFVLKNASSKYYKWDDATKSVEWVEQIDQATELLTNSGLNGNVVVFKGLADGVYTIIENTVPDGYNKAEDQSVSIEKNVANDNLNREITVINKAGSLLPSTGGMGTTLLYVGGAVLVIGAVVMLVVRRRMSENN